MKKWNSSCLQIVYMSICLGVGVSVKLLFFFSVCYNQGIYSSRMYALHVVTVMNLETIIRLVRKSHATTRKYNDSFQNY